MTRTGQSSACLPAGVLAAPAGVPAATKNEAVNYANDSLSVESRNPAIPSPNLGFPLAPNGNVSPRVSGMDGGLAVSRNNEPFPSEFGIPLAYDADLLPELFSMEYSPEKDGEKVRFLPSPHSSATRTYVSLTVGGDDYQARYEEDRELTRGLVAWQAQWGRDMRGLSESTVCRQEQLLRRFFEEPLIADPLLGLRPPTARELLQPDAGRVLVLHAKKALAESYPEGVVIDFLNAIRRFARFICENGAALPSGENVRKRWGQLVCPIGDHEIPKRRSKSDVFLPPIELMPAIFEATQDWAGVQRKPVTAQRTAAVTTLCFQSGMRGVEARRASLDYMPFDRSLGVAGLPNPLALKSAKNTPPRPVLVDPFGFDSLKFWLEHWRPELVGNVLEGHFFPSSSAGKKLSSSSLSETSSRLLEYLKERNLVDESFTFHCTRKTYTSHFLEKHGTEVGWLLNQCGWSSPAQLPVYVRPSADSIGAQRRQFNRSLGRRSNRR